MNLQKIKNLFFPSGFTLIELIVVITILAILGTIGFISVGGYSSRARDSARVGDVANIMKSLDISTLTVGDYPLPDNAFAVTYSGGVVWNQGVVGNNVLQVFGSSIGGGGLNKKPMDPLKNTEYTYSELAEGRAYQIKIDYEGDLTQTALVSPMTTPAFAAPGNPTIAYIRGNYAGLTAKTTTGGIVYVLAIPSIITNSGTTVNGRVSIENNALSGSLLFNGKSLTNATSYNPNTTANSGVIFSGTALPANDTTGAITNMVTALKAAYGSAPDISSNANIANLISATGSTAIQALGATIVSSQLGGSTVSTTTSTTNTSINCVGAWSICSSSCNQTYLVTTPASGGGSACPTASGTTQGCTGGTCPAPGICNNTAQYACTNGSPINQVAGSCGGSSTWNCTTAGGTSAQCNLANAACAVNGSCNNSTPLGCTTGVAINDNGQTSCGTVRTWNCASSNGGSTSSQCSISNAACVVCNNVSYRWYCCSGCACAPIQSSYRSGYTHPQGGGAANICWHHSQATYGWTLGCATDTAYIQEIDTGTCN